MAAAREIPLAGGRLTAGVVRVGATVRRPASEASPFVRALLAHLESAGFAGAPRSLGVDERGRDVLGWIPGTVVARWRRWSDAQVAAAGRLLRGLHDAARGSALAGAHETVCHHDAGPNNAVFRGGLPVALIDFDFAAPGPALEDVAYAAWAWCLASKPERGPVAAQAEQLRVLADAYGLDAAGRAALVPAILARQRRNVRWWSAREADAGLDPAARAHAAEVIAWSGREHAFVARHAAGLSARLPSGAG